MLSSYFKLGPTIRVLSLSRCGITDATLEVLIDAVNESLSLEDLDLSHNRIGALESGGCFNKYESPVAHLLESNHLLVKVDISDNLLSGDGVGLIGAAIRGSSSLQDVNLSHNNIGNRGGSLMLEAVKETRSLHRIDLRRCLIPEYLCDQISIACVERCTQGWLLKVELA